MSKQLKAAGLYAFAGLMTQGIRQAGYDVIGVMEDGDFGVETAMINHPKVPVFTEPTYWPEAQLIEADLDFIYGQPACAGFSMANRNRGLDSPKNEGLINANRFAQKIQPRVFAVESVTQLFKDGEPLVEQWEKEWQALGYQTCRLHENSAHLGLPQQRKRAIFMAAKGNIDFEIPNRPHTTIIDAIGDLVAAQDTPLPQPYPMAPFSSYQREMRGTESELTWNVSRKLSRKMTRLAPLVPAGKRMRAMSDEVFEQAGYWEDDAARARKGRPSFLYARTAWDRPSPVLTGGATYIHPTLHRHFTVRETARLMGLPDSWVFSSLSASYAEIGKAVSPIVAEWLGGQVANIIRDPGGRKHRDEVVLL